MTLQCWKREAFDLRLWLCYTLTCHFSFVIQEFRAIVDLNCIRQILQVEVHHP